MSNRIDKVNSLLEKEKPEIYQSRAMVRAENFRYMKMTSAAASPIMTTLTAL